MSVYLFLAQRLSAAVLAPLVLVHLATILYVSGEGLTAAEILGRTRGSIAWGGFYGLFVVAAAVHAAAGVRVVLGEWTRVRAPVLDVAAAGFGLVLLGLGARALVAVL